MLIIGGGIVGLLTAYFLNEKRIPYILAEQDKICGGTTANTTAKITFQHGLIYAKILKTCGTAAAREYLQANMAAFNKYAELCKSIDCDYERKDNYVYSLNDYHKPEDELNALQKIGYNAKLCKELPLPLKTVGAVCFENQAQFNPLKFLYFICKNLNIYEHTHISEMIGTTAKTEHGRIFADKVIVATHFPFINKHGSYFLKLYQHRSYVLALENADNVDGMYVDDCKTGLSFRSYKNLLLLGGGAHRTGKQSGGFNELQQFASVHYPYSEIKYRWATQDCMSLDSLPYIGRYSKITPEMYVACGFNKWGMTGAMLSALTLSDMVSGKQSEYEELFSPSRSILKPQLAINGFEAVKNLLTPTTKRCPHMGCALKWNAAEHTWDCACHGSRFNKSGKVLNNPANEDLK